jgi:hypothetical protein
MNKRFFYIIQFIAVMSFQILVLNDIVIKGKLVVWGIPVFIPMIYPMLILLLPINQNYLSMIFYALSIGFILDYFSNTPGLHAATMVLMTYLRPQIVSLFYHHDTKKSVDVRPTIYRFGFTPFLMYVSVSLIIHHFFFYTLQIWSFKNIPLIFFKTILSVLLSVTMILIGQLLFYSSGSKSKS